MHFQYSKLKITSISRMFSKALLLVACVSGTAESVTDPAKAADEYHKAHAVYKESVQKASSLLSNMKEAISNLRAQTDKYKETESRSLALLEQKSKADNEKLEQEESQYEQKLNALALKSSSLLQTHEAPKLVDDSNIRAWKDKLVSAMEKLAPFTKLQPSFIQTNAKFNADQEKSKLADTERDWEAEAKKFASSVIPQVAETQTNGPDLAALQTRVMQLGEKLNKDIIRSEQHIKSIQESAQHF